MEGLVLRSTGSWYEVWVSSTSQKYSCRTAGKLKLIENSLTNPIASGDRVLIHLENDQQGIIDTILPRKNYIVRQSPKSKHQLHLIASNIDLAVLVSTIIEPTLKPGFIDRFLLTTEPQNIPVIILFNKTDLYGPAEWEELQKNKKVYEQIGYKVIAVSSQNQEGIAELKENLVGKTTLFSGQSGVGKSSLLNVIFPGLHLKTNIISDASGKGTHTTTFAEMFPYEEGGFIIDTPGIKALNFNNLEVMDVVHNFREMFALSSNCKFGSQCTHRNEPDCMVKQAVEQGSVSELRYKNYITILDELEGQNHWERNKKY